MTIGQTPDGFLLGDRVEVLIGKAKGLTGEVVSVLQAHVLWMESGRPGNSFMYCPGHLCVVVTIDEKRVAVCVDPVQVIRRPSM